MSVMPDEAFLWQGWTDVTVDPPPVPAPNAYLAEVEADDPVGWWHLAEANLLAGCLDASLNGHDGAYTPTGVGLGFGQPSLLAGLPASTCVRFTGGRARIPTGAWLDFSAGFTAEAWIKPSTIVGNDTILSHDDDASPGTELAWRLRLNAGKLEAVLRTAAGVTHTLLAPAAVAANTIHHGAMTFDNATLRLYLDGVQVNTKAIVGPVMVSTQPLYIGKLADYGSENFDGWIDEPAVYAAPLAAARLAAHVAAGNNPPPADIDPPPYTIRGWETDPDRSHALHSFGVTYGRPDAHSRCRPLQSDVTLAGDEAGACPSSGERFRLALSDDAAAALGLEPGHALFTGEVTDPTIEPVVRTYSLTGMGRLGRGYRQTLKTEDWKVQVDGARVSRVLARAGIEAGDIDAGTVDLAAPDGTASAGNLLESVTDSTGGSLVEQPDGLVDYHDADHRRATPVTLTLTAGQIDNRLEWEQRVDDLLNDLTVAWVGGEVVSRDAASIQTRGSFPGRITTALTSATDAHSLGQLLVSRRSEPVWQLPNLEVDLMRMVDAPLRGALLELRHGDRILVTGIPLAHPYNGDVEFFVEGWRMRVDRPIKDQPWRWKLTLAVSDPTLSGVSLRWVDLPVGLAWNELPVGLSWLDLAHIEDPADL